MSGRLLYGVAASVAGSLGHSLGMTLQKRAHLRLESQGENMSSSKYRSWRDAEWQFGLGLYLFSSTVPPTIALTILPVFVAAPLAAVGLVANAVFAKYILASSFAHTDLLGTLLVSLGSCCVAVFGAIEEPPLSLEELLKLYSRPAYVVFFALYSTLVVCLIATELFWRRRYVRLALSSGASSSPPSREVALHQVPPAPRWPLGIVRSASTERAPLLLLSPPESSSGYSSVTEQLSPEPSSTSPLRNHSGISTSPPPPASTEAVDCMYRRHFSETNEALLLSHDEGKTSRGEQVARYVSGLLSAVLSGLLCSQTLLLAKSGIGLLLLTFQGDMQLHDPLALAIAAGLVTTALSNLYYIQRALRLCSTLTVVPLSYCSSSLSALLSSLVYFDQVRLMSAMQISMISVGIVMLAAGVGLLSSKADDQDGPLHLPPDSLDN
ncbi:hypothetical protein IWW38_002805 [Coemansia aciculifera]|uniref:Uncharacterized protein n=1 Tax=Coemansia aciculifera TaxID=417176 RepID=A0ACC1M2E7_9FUNG|nr:hypothetical protein IWW38_002805 [Coemansia aciculifera]